MTNKWSEVARLFYEKSGQKYFRTGKQCREHWMNHLDPSKEQYIISNLVENGIYRKI